MKQIQWYPGHMSKALREVKEKLKLVDIIIEIVDARIPYSSSNPILNEIIINKPKIILFTKYDLSDKSITNQWKDYYEKNFSKVIVMDILNNFNKKIIIDAIEGELIEKRRKEKEKGLKSGSIRAMILGIPNVGKSTFINKFSKRKATKTANKPGVTKNQQWIRVNEQIELLDTPGILWPKIENEISANNIALIGSIKDQILPKDDIVIYALNFLNKYYKGNLEKRYSLDYFDADNIVNIYDTIGKKNGCLISKSEINYDKVNDLILRDLRQCYLGKITFDRIDNFV